MFARLWQPRIGSPSSQLGRADPLRKDSDCGPKPALQRVTIDDGVVERVGAVATITVDGMELRQEGVSRPPVASQSGNGSKWVIRPFLPFLPIPQKVRVAGHFWTLNT